MYPSTSRVVHSHPSSERGGLHPSGYRGLQVGGVRIGHRAGGVQLVAEEGALVHVRDVRTPAAALLDHALAGFAEAVAQIRGLQSLRS